MVKETRLLVLQYNACSTVETGTHNCFAEEIGVVVLQVSSRGHVPSVESTSFFYDGSITGLPGSLRLLLVSVEAECASTQYVGGEAARPRHVLVPRGAGLRVGAAHVPALRRADLARDRLRRARARAPLLRRHNATLRSQNKKSADVLITCFAESRIL